MKNSLVLLVVLFILPSATMTHAQSMQQVDPQTAQAISDAIQRGDVDGAKNIYQAAKKSSKESQDTLSSAPSATVPEPLPPSLFEQKIAGNLRQFGYDLFNRTTANFSEPAMLPVGPDYIIGPGDQFTLTMWGTTEGIYTLRVTKEGEITLPKVGVVPVAGVRFGGLEKTLKRHLAKYYSDFNLSVAMGSLKTNTLYVVGEVAKPGSYSLSSLTTVYGALFAAGGPTRQGTLRSIQVLRSGKVIKSVDLYEFLLKGDRSQDMRLQNEDTVFVPLIGPIAGVAGTVYRPAIYELKGRETISDLIETAGGIMPIALGGRLQLVRYEDNRKKTILNITLDSGTAGGENTRIREFTDPVLNMDSILISPVYDQVWETVDLAGAVEHPGSFQWRPDLRLREIIIQGRLLPRSDRKRAEVIRLSPDMMDRTIISVDLAALMAGDESRNIKLEPQDQVRVFSALKAAEKVIVSGEVMRSGEYEINKEERLSDLMRRAGGFTAEAYPYGAVFKRKGVRDSEARNMKVLITKTQSEIIQTAAARTATALSAEEAQFARAEQGLGQSLLGNLKAMQELSEGRVAISITGNIDEWAGSKQDLLLQDGDSLMVPKRPQEVLVLGEVFTPGAQIHQPGMSVGDYLGRTGGVTKNADEDMIFIVQADGYAFGSDSPSVDSIEKIELKAGDSIIVPQKTERYAAMRNTKDIVDILFKTAVVIATIMVLF